jgi:hypothetical protein
MVMELRVLNIVISKGLIFKSIKFPHSNIHKHTWTFPDGKAQNRIDRILTDARRHSSVFEVRTFRGPATDLYLVVAKT